MADYGGGSTTGIFLSRDLSHASTDSPSHSSDHDTTNPLSPPTITAPPIRSSSSSPSPSQTHQRKRPRGRPPGSKNKPKPPIIITKETDPSTLKPTILEISPGSDVVESIITFARRGAHMGLSLISATGSVSNITIRHPSSHSPSVLTMHGPFNLLSLSGSFISRVDGSFSSSFGVSLAGPQGQVFGGVVAGKVVAASQVVVVAATFLNPAFHRLPSGENDQSHDVVKPNCTKECNNSVVSASGGAGMCSVAIYGGGGMVVDANPISSCQLSTNTPPDIVRWGPPSRPPY